MSTTNQKKMAVGVFVWLVAAVGLFVFMLSTAKAFGAEAAFDKEVTFVAVGRPSLLKVKGTCKGRIVKKDPVSDIKGEKGFQILAEVDLNSCDTGINLRNEHMRTKYLETGKYPRALLHGSLIGPGFTGTLIVHGKDSAVTGTFAKGKLTFKTSLSAHGIAEPGFKGITVANEVTIEAGIE